MGASFQSFKTSNEETPSNRDYLKPPKLYDWELGSDNEWRRVPGPKKKYFQEKPFVSFHAPKPAAATGFLVPSSSKIANDETVSDFRYIIHLTGRRCKCRKHQSKEVGTRNQR